MLSVRRRQLTNSGPVSREVLVSSAHVEIFAAAASREDSVQRQSTLWISAHLGSNQFPRMGQGLLRNNFRKNPVLLKGVLVTAKLAV